MTDDGRTTTDDGRHLDPLVLPPPPVGETKMNYDQTKYIITVISCIFYFLLLLFFIFVGREKGENQQNNANGLTG